VYDVQIGGAPAGSVEVAWTWLPAGDRRVVTQHTRATLLGKPLETRCTASLSRRGTSTTCAATHGHDAWEVQARGREGLPWDVRLRERSGEATSAPKADFTTLDLYDAARAPALLASGETGRTVTVLVAETGEVITGTLQPPVAAETRVGGKVQTTTRHEVRAALGGLSVDLDLDGVLLRAELRTRLGSMTYTARTAPPARAWGTLEGLDLDGGVREAP
jgi:hypothetical protein